LLALPLNWSKAFIASFCLQQKNKEIQSKRMKRHSKRHVSSLYYN
jgi:hypothetical protein